MILPPPVSVACCMETRSAGKNTKSCLYALCTSIMFSPASSTCIMFSPALCTQTMFSTALCTV